MQKRALPKKNKYGFYEIRFESIGGLGANVAGKILGEAGVLGEGFNGSSFSSYGSEKKGTPVKTFIRFCDPDHPVYINSPVEEPHLLAIFHERLLNTGNVMSGINHGATVIVNSKKSPEELRAMMKMPAGTLGIIDALGIAIEEKTRINMVILGAVVRALEFINLDTVKKIARDTFGSKYAHLMEYNYRGLERGFKEVKFVEFDEDEKYHSIPFKRVVPELGYKNAPIGGVIVNPGNTVQKDLSASRQGFIPVLDLNKCVHCGECDMVCPDYCFVWERRVAKNGKEAQFLVGIDYQYCKGCLRCVEVCKPHALTEHREDEYDLSGLNVRHGIKL
jgi:pyruvate ferredoxin oxidoreductase gamma subunit